jgi:uracil-DNA glycosylase
MSLIDFNKIHKSWEGFFSNEIIEELNKIEKEIGNDYFPNTNNVLRFMSLDLNQIKYIIVGMEPYPSYKIVNDVIIPEATGRSFEIQSVDNWSQKFKQSSLRNILKTIYYNEYNEKISLEEVRKKIEEGSFPIKQPHQWFDCMEQQGVMFLNATLTVQMGKVDTHTKIWEHFMNSLIQYIDTNNNSVNWLLWGNKAQDRICPLVHDDKVIISQHPRLAQFVDENCFKYAQNVNWLG